MLFQISLNCHFLPWLLANCCCLFVILDLLSDDVDRSNETRLYHYSYKWSNGSAHIDNLLHHTDMRMSKA